MVTLAVGITLKGPPGLADDCGGPSGGGRGLLLVSQEAVLCSVDAHLDKLQGEQRHAETLNFPFLSLVPADYASCFSKSFPDIGNLLLSYLVIVLSLSCVSQRGCPCALQLPSLCSSPVSWPPQVIPLC